MSTQSIKNRRHAAVLIALVVAAGSGAGAAAGGYHALHASGTPQHTKPPVHTARVTPTAVTWLDDASGACLPNRVMHAC